MKSINLTIQKAAYGGYGLGFHEGKACFVPYAVPGDVAEIEIIQDKKSLIFGRIIRLEREAVTRIKPECPNFGICGGCDYLNITYEAELEIKKNILRESIVRIAGMNAGNIPEISVVCADRFGYRSHASVKSDGKGVFGFYMRDSNTLVPFPDGGCRLLAPPLVELLKSMNAPQTQEKHAADELKIACSDKGDCFTSAGEKRIVRELVNGIVYERDISLFFQANRFLRSKMLDIVKEYADTDSSGEFLDIGCGVGFFTLYLAKHAKQANGIDISKDAIKQAKRNAKLNEIGNASFEARSASGAGSLKHKYHTVIADPPRAGLSANARVALKALAPGRIVYVSCDPATFARDSRDIASCGYRMQKLTLIDMFPGTQHIEVIALFS